MMFLRSHIVILAAAFCTTAAAAPQGHGQHHPPGTMDHAVHCGLPAGIGAAAAIDVRASRITIVQRPDADLGTPEITKTYTVAKTVDLAAFTPGEKLHFLLAPQKDKAQRIVSLCSMDVAQGAHEACMKSMHETAMKIAAASGMPCAATQDAPQSKGHEGHH